MMRSKQPKLSYAASQGLYYKRLRKLLAKHSSLVNYRINKKGL